MQAVQQVAFADRLLLNKTDLVSESEKNDVIRTLKVFPFLEQKLYRDLVTFLIKAHQKIPQPHKCKWDLSAGSCKMCLLPFLRSMIETN